MKTEALLRDSVFQLNLLIWMAKEQPAIGYRVRPVFLENGFRLVYIEQPFAFPDATARAIEATKLAIRQAPEPEMILRRNDDENALYFEAKPDSFGLESTNCKQARGHLLATGPAFAETLKPMKKALLCYVVPKDRCDLMAECLTALSAELQSAGFAPGESSVHGLAVNGQDLVYSWDAKFKQHSGTRDDSVAIIHDLQEDTDPSPLLLIFTDEDCPDGTRSGFYRKVLINQVVAKLVCDLNLLVPGTPYSTTARDLLLQTTDGILNFVGRDRQRSMIRTVRQNIFARIAKIWREKPFTPVSVDGDRLEIAFKDDHAKWEFMDWLEDSKSTKFSDERPSSEYPDIPGLIAEQGGPN